LDDDWVMPASGGSVLRIHVRPGASRAGLAGLHGGALALRVGARPVEGAANREVLTVLARALDLRSADLELTSGATGRDKRVLVRGLSPAAVRAALAPLLRV